MTEEWLTPDVRRTARSLADGRAITYYDRPGAPERRASDTRAPDTVITSSELRRDALTGEWVIVAGHRQGRTFLPAASDCPLCPSRAGSATEVPEPDYQVAVFDNRFPSLTPTAHLEVPETADLRAGVGRCEVVCFTSDHGSSLAAQSTDRIELVVRAWADRTAHMAADGHVAWAYVFENRGEEIGVTLHHPHGQVYGYPFIPPRARLTLDAAAGHRSTTGRDLYDDLLERGPDELVLRRTDHWVALVPEAARWPFHLRVLPRRDVGLLPHLTDAEVRDFAELYRSVLRALDSVFDRPLPYISGWHQRPLHDPAAPGRLFLELFSLRRAADRLKYLAGSESGAGVWINDIRPEVSAATLRAALDAPR